MSKVCKYFQRGCCSRGSDCIYSHNIQCFDVNSSLKGNSICVFYERGNCINGNKCTFTHFTAIEAADDKNRSGKDNKSCVYFQFGNCSRGDKCAYLHKNVLDNPAPCVYFQQGHCVRGNKCEYSHSVAKIENIASVEELQNRTEKPICVHFRSGFCSKGTRCAFTHSISFDTVETISKFADLELDSPISPNRNLLSDKKEPNNGRAPAVCKFFARGCCENGRSCTFLHDLSAIANDDADNTLPTEFSFCETNGDEITVGLGQHLQCKLGPGAVVLSLKQLSSKGTNRVCINGLTEAISDHNIHVTLSVFGAVREIIRKHPTYCYAIFETPSAAEEAVRVLHGSSARNNWNSKVKATRDTTVAVTLAALPGSVVTQNSTVKVMWYTPTRIGWAQFQKKWEAERVAKMCNGLVVNGVALSAEFQEPTKRNQKIFSVVFTKISDGVTSEMLEKAIAGKSRVELLSFKLDTPVADNRLLSKKEECAIVKRRLEHFGPLTLFEVTPGLDPKRKAIAKFALAEDSSNAVTAMTEDPIIVEANNIKLFLEKVFTAKFSVLLPIYTAVQSEVSLLLDSCSGNVRYKLFPSEKLMVLRLTGDGSKSISSIKSRLQRIFSGEWVLNVSKGRASALWLDFFVSAEAKAAFKEIETATQAVVERNFKRREVVIYGTAAARSAAQKALLAMTVDHLSIPVSTQCLKHLFSLGIAGIEELTGASYVLLDIIRKALIVQGDKKTRETVAQFISNLMDNEKEAEGNKKDSDAVDTSVCPVCFGPPNESDEYVDGNNTVRLSSCGHYYCRSCFDMWMSQAISGDNSCSSSFPLKCCSSNCGVPLRVTDIKAFARDHFPNIVRASLSEFILKNIDAFQFCVTPDCENIHSTSERVANCAACSVSVCTKCKVEEHEGLTCQENQIAKAPLNQERNKILEDIFTLKCPRCRKAFLDFDGCFALKCSSCPCAFCGWCLSDCGTDAHQHVLQCEMKPQAENCRTYFGTSEQFKESARKRIISELKIYLSKKDSESRASILRSIADDLEDMNIPLSAFQA